MNTDYTQRGGVGPKARDFSMKKQDSSDTKKSSKKAYLAVLVDYWDHSHTQDIVWAEDSVEAARLALEERIRVAEIYDEKDSEESDDNSRPPYILQGDEAGSSCYEFSEDAKAGFATIAVYDAAELRDFLKSMEL
jgi:hypothetical protein